MRVEVNVKRQGIFRVAYWAWSLGLMVGCGHDQVSRDQGNNAGAAAVDLSEASGGSESTGTGTLSGGASGGDWSEPSGGTESGGASGGTLSGGASGGGWSEATGGASGGDFGLDCSSEPTLDCPCAVLDEEVCAGSHQSERLKCDGSIWHKLADCDDGELCEDATALCQSVVSECVEEEDGYRFCEGAVRHSCAADWLSTLQATCIGGCQDGACYAPDCGDGVLQTETEACDDGNLDADDGCDEECVPTPGWYCPEGQDCVDCSSGPALGCPCVDTVYPSGGHRLGDTGCNGAAQKLSLACDTASRLWATGPVCSAGQNCEQSSGHCKAIVSGCSGQSGEYSYCSGDMSALDVRNVCDADLVNINTTTCEGVCSGGACQAARCGDGKLQAGETCDDGNNTAADGCEPASSSAPCQESGVVKVEPGRDFTCALLVGGYVRCWGNNEKGQLGVGNTTFYGNKHPREIPLVGLSEAAVALSAERFHACVVTISGAIECWGDNEAGQLGQGTAVPNFSASPKRIDFGTDAVQVSTGGYHACARLINGSVRCWGDNSAGQLGIQANGAISTTTAATALAVPKLGANAQQVVANEVASCALLSGGSVRCWGGNLYGELGIGLTRFELVGDNEDPEDVSVLAFRDSKSIKDLSVGTNHICGVSTGTETQCWGRNTAGQLGVSDKVNVGRENLALASGKDLHLSQVVSLIAGGGSHTCAISTTQALQCWGSNQYGQLGFADITDDGVAEEEWGGIGNQQAYKAPNLFTGSLAATQIGLGTNHTCALSQNGELRCWGQNESSQLGLGYVSSGAKDYVGKTAAELPALLPALEVFP